MRVNESIAQTIDVLDALHCGAMLVEPEGIIVHANARLCRMMRRAAEELLRRPFWHFYPPADAERLQTEFHQDVNAEVERETQLPRPGSDPLAVIISSRPLDRHDSLPGYRIFTIIDISRQKEAESRYQWQYEELVRLGDTVLEQALDLKQYSRTLEGKIDERTAELKEANIDSILMLAVASEVRDSDTGAHVLRIRDYSELLARELSLPASEVEEIGFSSILHDVGKIQVLDEILKKPGRLTVDERKTMETHTIAGERILSKRPFFNVARTIARGHHENWDGSGYPDGLGGADIPLPARIVHLVDVFDALTTPRVYKPAWPVADAVAELKRQSGRMFDPQLTPVFLGLVETRAVDGIMSFRDPHHER